MIKELKILYLSGANREEKIIELLKKGSFKTSFLVLKAFGEVQKQLQGFSPDVVLADHFESGNFSAEQGKIIHEMAPAASMFLLTDFESEHSALQFLDQGIQDYFFFDRPARLLFSLENLVKNELDDQ